ncbi:MAG TPA: hypothetical protein VFX65_12955 [Candidatus Limnocylindrales bacterium]|nr:hypothetical protein [Candidatus Limnocylindrales bacterium]
MPDLRAVVIAVGVGLGVAGYTILWWHWPIPLGAGAGILLGGLALTGASAPGTEGAAADEAWVAAAPDLQDPPAGPPPDVLPRAATGPAVPVVPSRSHDLPSGD